MSSTDSGAPSDDPPSTSSGATDPADGGSTTDDVKFDISNGSDAPGIDPEGGGDGDCLYLDILFVVDISLSMQEEKDNLNANFPAFVQVLDEYVAGTEALGYRIGATNSSHTKDDSTRGLDGALVNSGGISGMEDCGTGGAYWLDGPAPGLDANFPCLANESSAPCDFCSDNGVERPLDSMMGFIDKIAAGGVNNGFYRGAESLLVIVTLTDEDDQSEATPEETKAALDALTQGEERYVIVSVAGRQDAGCESAFGDAIAAPRLHQFTNSVTNGLMGDICEGDLTQALDEALELITFSCDTLPPPEG